jgi:hypothetical protein
MLVRSGVGRVLYLIRHDLALTLDAMAQAGWMSRTTYHATEVGHRQPRPEELERLAQSLKRPELAILADSLRQAAKATAGPEPAR